ncbi:BTB/POZ domain-containing protein 9-like isoform X2 [Dinothrombium tinctorium]|uniref:BTB/POZ domain-containing protein 9-like isoform X2 n=1 Tax=Dinothrombium tinctorium TaxID=1965070 RepID=A0A443QFG4_9ACAR|nr:BTB/POZ domain-containing protein 9-like isoform X2 [Dinothrombium tinctorium]
MNRNEFLLKIENPIENLFNNEESSDVILEFGSPVQRVFAHKAVLSANSDYFKKMFFEGGWKESNQNTVELQDINAEIFTLLLKAFYGITLEFDALSCFDLLVLRGMATQYCSQKFEEVMDEAIINRLSSENVAEFYSMAVAADLPHLVSQFKDYFHQHFTEIVRVKSSFKTLSKEWAIEILKNDELRVAEIDVFISLLEWTKHHESSEEETKEMMQYIKLELIILCDFLKQIRPTKIFTDTEILNALESRSNNRLNGYSRISPRIEGPRDFYS